MQPPVDILSTAYLGDKILTQGVATQQDALYFSHTTKVLGYTIGAGYYPKRGEDAKYIQYSIFDNSDGAGRITVGLLFDPADSIMIRKSDNSVCILTIFSTIASCYHINPEKRNWIKPTNKNFQQVLVYHGKVGNEINISYLEYYDNSNRPTLNTSVKYDLSYSNQIGYKGSLLDVVQADNQRIQYRVIRGFINQ